MTGTKIYRTQYLYFLAAGHHVDRLIAPPIAATLMSRSLYTPFLVAIIIQGSCLLLIHFFWYPVPPMQAHMVFGEDYDPTLLGESDNLSTAHAGTTPIDPTESSINNQMHQTPLRRWWEHPFHTIIEASAVFNHPTARFCLTAYFCKRIGFAAEAFMFQYVSEKFHWPLQQTTWLRVADAGGAITATFIICPVITSYLSGRGIPSCITDLGMIRSALLIPMISFFLAWEAPSAILFGLCMSAKFL